MASLFKEEIINIQNVQALKNIFPFSGRAYNIDIKVLRLDFNYTENFVNICKCLKTSTTIKSLFLDFWLDESGLIWLADGLGSNNSITHISLYIDKPIDKQAIGTFVALIQNNRTLKTIEFQLEPSSQFTNEQLLDSVKGLNIPTRHFKLFIPNCHDAINTNQFYDKMIEVLDATKISKIEWYRKVSLFSTATIHNALNGFKKFSEYLAKSEKIKTIETMVFVDDVTLPYIQNFTLNCKQLRTVSLKFGPSAPSRLENFLDALSTSTIKDMTVWGLGDVTSPYPWLNIARALKSMQKLQVLSTIGVQRTAQQQFVEIMKESEVLREFLFRTTDYAITNDVNAMSLRNKKLQNSRTRDLIVILFNIARDTSSVSSVATLPRDIWPIIMSFVRVPGVSLDFGRVAQSIFKDSTVRRVIYKSIKKNKYYS